MRARRWRGRGGPLRGMTLLEVLVVITLLALLASVLAVNYRSTLAGAKHKVAQQEIAKLKDVLEQYYLETGTYPTQSEGLSALQRPLAGRSEPMVTGRIKDLQSFVFSPARAQDEREGIKRLSRKSRVQPSQWCRKKLAPKRCAGSRYDTRSYHRALSYAIVLAQRAGALADGVSWHPHQLRHSFATRVRRQHGLDAARALLGHRTLSQTDEYAELDGALATKVIAQLG